MKSNMTCMQSIRTEVYNISTGNYNITGVSDHTACITTLDLSTLHPDAVGFRRGFVDYPYIYLSPGEYSVALRLNIESFHLSSTNVVDMGAFDPTLGGYQGGFADGNWACYSPYRSYIGPIGMGGVSGIRSTYRKDKYQLRPFYYSVVACINASSWNHNSTISIVLYDFSKVYPDLKGFSDVVKVGRYVYFAPFMDTISTYSSKLVRLFLGEDTDVGTTIQNAKLSNTSRKLTTVLDLSMVNMTTLRGYNGIINAGKYIYLIPYRNENDILTGSRGHGNVVRIDLNNFTIHGIQVVDPSTSIRAQIPSDPDIDLRGYSGGFSSGNYAILVPFYNGIISGKVGRIRLSQPYHKESTNFTSEDVQVLNLAIDRQYPNLFKGYRGGFTCLQKNYSSLPTLGVINSI